MCWRETIRPTLAAQCKDTAMLHGQKIVVVMPADNAARTLLHTYQEVMAWGFTSTRAFA